MILRGNACLANLALNFQIVAVPVVNEGSVSFSNLRKFLAVLCDDNVWFLTSK